HGHDAGLADAFSGARPGQGPEPSRGPIEPVEPLVAAAAAARSRGARAAARRRGRRRPPGAPPPGPRAGIIPAHSTFLTSDTMLSGDRSTLRFPVWTVQ